LNSNPVVYRVSIKPKNQNDPRSLGYLNDIRALGIDGVSGIECSDLYFLRGDITAEQVRMLTDRLLCDTVTHAAEIDCLNMCQDTAGENRSTSAPSGLIEVALRAGVTDPVAEQIVRAARIVGIDKLNAASTGLRFFVKGGNLSEPVLRQLAERLFANPVIQRYALGVIFPSFTEAVEASGTVEVISLRGLDDDGLMKISADRRAALNLNEMKTIQAYCLREQRDLTDIEFEMLAQTWSEHCVHKTFKSRVTVEQEDASDPRFPQEYNHLFNQTIRAATRDINADWVLSSFRENAGIVEFDGENEISFKVETHNHPSAIEPFGGANTGIGGVIRDVIGVSHKPIASTDILCFGPQNTRLQDLPEGVLHPRRIESGVVAGIEDYGNRWASPRLTGLSGMTRGTQPIRWYFAAAWAWRQGF
jgi:phosphoribosylformylglycinamidine synthase